MGIKITDEIMNAAISLATGRPFTYKGHDYDVKNPSIAARNYTILKGRKTLDDKGVKLWSAEELVREKMRLPKDHYLHEEDAFISEVWHKSSCRGGYTYLARGTDNPYLQNPFEWLAGEMEIPSPERHLWFDYDNCHALNGSMKIDFGEVPSAVPVESLHENPITHYLFQGVAKDFGQHLKGRGIHEFKLQFVNPRNLRPRARPSEGSTGYSRPLVIGRDGICDLSESWGGWDKEHKATIGGKVGVKTLLPTHPTQAQIDDFLSDSVPLEKFAVLLESGSEVKAAGTTWAPRK